MQASPVRYQVRVLDTHAHLFQVTLTIGQPMALQQVRLPTWIPGSYLIREFSKNLQCLVARQGKRRFTPVQLDKCTWQAECSPDKALVLSYEVYAFDASVRTAWLDTHRGFFNGTSLLLQVVGQEAREHRLELADPALPGWHAATALRPLNIDPLGFGTYGADNYDELVDAPVEMGDFWSGTFEACGIRHRFLVAGAPPGFDGVKLLADTQKICETQIRFWHGSQSGASERNQPVHENYLFILNAVSDGYGGLEHRNSTALICKRRDLPRDANTVGNQGYNTLLGLISHEYFHAWNVKRLRPIEFAQVDYQVENYTRLLWFFEGFTSYYDELLLRRAGLINDADYLALLAKTVNQVMQTPGREIQSVSQASFDAWVKYYRQDENTPNATVSYYTKGALVALCLDLTLRQEQRTTLDAVMRALWVKCNGGPMKESDLTEVLERLAGRSLARELSQWVQGKGDLPIQQLLEQHGVSVQEEPAGLAQRLGIRLADGAAVRIKTVLRGSAAEKAGFAAGDEWLGIEVGRGQGASAWRMTQLDDLLLYGGDSKRVKALICRDMRLHRLDLALPKASTTLRLAVGDGKRVSRWLSDR